MEQYYQMPNAFFNAAYNEYIGGIVFHLDHVNGKDKILKVVSKLHQKWFAQFLKNNPCPGLISLTKEQAEEYSAPLTT